MALVRAEPAPRLFAVNADEGEPGTFKDRYYLERDPHRFIEGMLIAAWVVEAAETYLYIRDEYPELRLMLAEEIDKVEKAGLSPHTKLHLRRGAGAYICGEESAMIELIEGKRGLPRHRPPYVAQVGLFGRPTLEQNVETLYWMRDIVEKGADWATSQGRHERKGFRSFSVSGRVKNPGVKLAPAGITVRELIDEFCGGMAAGETFKGYLPGGASGGILPASMADEPLDFGTLEKYGCFVGSHAVVILSDKDDMKAVAFNLMKFFEDESCGQCTPCRVGSEKAAKLMAQRPVGREPADRAVDRHARRLDLRPRPGGAEPAVMRAEISSPRNSKSHWALGESWQIATHKSPTPSPSTTARSTSATARPSSAPRAGSTSSCRTCATCPSPATGRRQLPRLHGGDRGRARARRKLHPHAVARHEGEDADRARQDRAQDGRRTSGHRSAGASRSRTIRCRNSGRP